MSPERSPQNRGVSRRDVLRRGAVATAIAGFGLSGLTGSAAAGGSGGNGVPSDAIPIDGPTVITEPGYYVVTKDIVEKEGGRNSIIGVVPGVTDVTIDGQGHTLEGPGEGRQLYEPPYGIFAGLYSDEDIENLTIKNLRVTGFSKGILLEEVTGGMLQNLKVSNCGDGIEYQSVGNVVLEDSISNNNRVGFFTDEGDSGNVFRRNRFTANSLGVLFTEMTDLLFKGNYVDRNDIGIRTGDGAAEHTYVDNLFYKNGTGLELDAFLSVLRGNRFVENTDRGVWLDFAPLLSIEDNDFLRNGEEGLFGTTWQSTISKNRVIGNGGDGFQLRFSYENELVGNLIRQNGGDGIELSGEELFGGGFRGSDDNVVRKNIIRENGDLPIRIDEFSTGNVVEDNRIGDDAPDTCRLEDY